jgi:hypothetical protein
MEAVKVISSGTAHLQRGIFIFLDFRTAKEQSKNNLELSFVSMTKSHLG